MKLKILLFMTILLFFSFPIPSLVRGEIQITGMYSNMQYIQEGGDVIGMEIFITYSHEGYFGAIQQAEGVPGIPIVVPIKIKNNKIEFEILSPRKIGYIGIFKGEITVKEIKGKFINSNNTVILKRKKSYWQQ